MGAPGPIGAYLAGRRPRPNPPVTWRLQRRHAEGGAWETVRAASEEKLLRDEVLAPTFELHEGDLVRLQNPPWLTVGFWVQTSVGLADAGYRPEAATRSDLGGGFDWVAFWEGPRADAVRMLPICEGIDPRRIVRLADAAASDLLARVRDPAALAEPRLVAARAVVARWLAGESVGVPALTQATEEARDAAEDATDDLASNAMWASGAAAGAAAKVEGGGTDLGRAVVGAAELALRAVAASLGDYHFGPSLAAAVPLSEVLLARALAARVG